MSQDYRKSKLIPQTWYPQKYLEYCVSLVDEKLKSGLWLECGTATGTTAEAISGVMPKDAMLYTFDSFEGLSESWGAHRAGSFAQDPPKLDSDRVEVVVGWFADTLPKFIQEHKEDIAFLHVDCDLYGSTKTVLDVFGDKIVPGTIIAFDEIVGHPLMADHEYRAFMEFVKHSGKNYEYVAHIERGNQAACRII
jgi:predicted O-methyltransferase YrrM